MITVFWAGKVYNFKIITYINSFKTRYIGKLIKPSKNQRIRYRGIWKKYNRYIIWGKGK